jgi:phospholipid/cholesterol/gamma-HCH transport system permease protein
MSTPEAAVGWFRAWLHAALFGFACAAAALSPSSYTPQTRALALRQIYFTAWQVLAGYLLFAAVLSLIVVRITVAATFEFGLSGYAVELVLRAMVLELLPLLTALFVALRSGSAIGTEIALMRVSGELDPAHAADAGPMQREFVPRVIASGIAVASLTVLGCTTATVVAYAAIYGFSPWGLEEYLQVIAHVFSLPALAGFLLKCTLFGFVVAVIPIAAGVSATRDIKSAPFAVMGAMVRLFFALGIIETAALAAAYA